MTSPSFPSEYQVIRRVVCACDWPAARLAISTTQPRSMLVRFIVSSVRCLLVEICLRLRRHGIRSH